MKNNREIGESYEKKAMELMLSSGYKILEKNYRVRTGEIDIIAEKSGVIVFVEVKYRSSTKFGYGIEAVDYRKMRRIYKTAKMYLMLNKKFSNEIRFDCISFLGEEVSWIKNLTWGDEIGF